MSTADPLTALEALWSTWKEHGESLTDEQWQRSTRLDGWDVRSLYAHAGAWPFGFAKLVGRVTDAEPTHESAVALLRELNRPDGLARSQSGRIAARAREDAETFSTEEMIEQFASVGPKAVDTARRLGPVAVDYSGLAVLRLDEAARIGIVEATVHLLDLQRALGRTPDVPADGLRHTTAVLGEMAPTVEFIEVATGRDDASVFPVMR
jgi:uncharacterized protein (TIGR03083 family)